MKNLKLNHHSSWELSHNKFFKICINPCQNEVYAVSSNGIQLLKQAPSLEQQLLFSQELWEMHTSKLSQVITLDYVTSNSCFCIIFIEGDIITGNVEDQCVEVVGSVSGGIQAACWSPDQELLAVVSTSSVILMTAEFEPIEEISLENDDFGEHKFINIGWGKKETQFHGSAGKQAAKESKDETNLESKDDDSMPRISWRGDGQLFVVSYSSQSLNKRIFRVINREGIIQFTSEIVEGLQEKLSWRPSGNLIASSQKLFNEHNIVFFEKNGLKKSYFRLPIYSKDLEVREVSWNADSSILLIFVELPSTSELVLQFWKVSNCRWYLKEEIIFDENIIDLCWDIDNPFMLYVLTCNSFHELQFVVTTDISTGNSEKDMANVAVINGKKLHITPFRQAVVPPPLSAYEVTFPNQIHEIMFAPFVLSSCNSANRVTSLDKKFDFGSCSSNALCIFHGNDILTFLEQYPFKDLLSDDKSFIKSEVIVENILMANTARHCVVAKCKIELKNNPNIRASQLFNWTWVSPTVIMALYIYEFKNHLIIFDIKGNNTDTWHVVPRSPIMLNEKVVTISLYNSLTVCVQMDTGYLFKIDLLSNAMTPWIEDEKHIKFPYPCDKVILCPFDMGCKPVGLSSRNKLYLEDTQLLCDCTSIHLHSNHLLLTTTSHNLIVVPLLLQALKSLAKGISEEMAGIGNRALERGARIVTAVPCDTRIILQLPRGNLEIISPRHLVVYKLKELLDLKDYHSVMELMRLHRIDMNLIYDHNPEIFINHIEHFISSVNNPHWIDLFIANLSNVDVTRTTYSSSYPHLCNSIINSKLRKVDLVSDTLREALIIVDEQKYLLPILTTYIKSSKEGMHLALNKLKGMKESGAQFKVGFEEGLKHLMYIADANELCDVALGTYDFNLIMLVYENSQKDPKEYLPFLNNLKNMEPDYQKFKINVHLKLYNTALGCLTNFEKHGQECLDLIKKESLYSTALDVVCDKIPFYKTVCSAYGEYLTKKGYDNEASAFFSRAGELQSAFKSYERSGNWRKLLATAFQLNFSNKEINELCYSIVEKLKEKDNYENAAIVYEKYLQSEEDAIDCLTKSYSWDDAFLLASKNDRSDLIDTNIKPSIYQCYNMLCSELKQKKASFSQYFERLFKVRDYKKREYFEILENGECPELDSELCSNSSTITGFSYQKGNMSTRSHTSSASGKSYRSSKNKRKLDRKKYSTKEGSNFEDVGLIAVLHELMVSVDGLTRTVSNLNSALLYIGDDSKAKNLQNTLHEVLHEIQKKKYDIWLNCAPPPQDELIEFGPEMTTESALKHANNGDNINNNNFFIQRINELEPNLRYPPMMENSSNWKLFSLM